MEKVRSKLGFGLQSTGTTVIDTDINVNISEDKIHVEGSKFVDVYGNEYSFSSKEFKLENKSNFPKNYSIILSNPENPKIELCHEFINDNPEIEAKPTNKIFTIIGWSWGLTLSSNSRKPRNEVYAMSLIDNMDDQLVHVPDERRSKRVKEINGILIDEIPQFNRLKGSGGKVKFDRDHNKMFLEDYEGTLSKSSSQLPVRRESSEHPTLKNCDESHEEHWKRTLPEAVFKKTMKLHYPNKKQRKEKMRELN